MESDVNGQDQDPERPTGVEAPERNHPVQTTQENRPRLDTDGAAPQAREARGIGEPRIQGLRHLWEGLNEADDRQASASLEIEGGGSERPPTMTKVEGERRQFCVGAQAPVACLA